MKGWIVVAVLNVISSAGVVSAGVAPDGLMVELLAKPEIAVVLDSRPEFSWIVRSGKKDDVQTAYRIMVAGSMEKLDKDIADVWDSGKIESAASVAVELGGEPLKPDAEYFWKVKTWARRDGESGWSAPQKFRTAPELKWYASSGYPLEVSRIAPVKIEKKDGDSCFLDFGRVAFGYLVLDIDSPVDNQVLTVHLGERGSESGVNRKPGGTVRYYRVEVTLSKGKKSYEIRAPRDGRNTGGAAIRIPDEIGVIAPFRYVEIENCPVEIKPGMVHQAAVHYHFNDQAASFSSSSDVLNDIWELCRYSMKATSFCGIYVDGERERVPYEADAYINQLSHYAVDREYTLARRSHEYLMMHPTWPTEWRQHSVLMAWADYMYTGDTESLENNYDNLRKNKTLEGRARKDGLLDTGGMRDIVDWPTGERDGYQFKPVNTVVNAFYYMTLVQMADMADALGKSEDAAMYRKKAENVKSIFNQKLFNEEKGLYIDGEGSDHSSLHANMMPLAFGLVPEADAGRVADFVVSKGMSCSVYGAQYLLEALYQAGRPEAALDLMTSVQLRSWHNMIKVGSTITLEAWDDRYKPNQDWNHAWGAAPGNIVARYLLGVRPLEPGFSRVLIRPMPAYLEQVSGKIPTIRGDIEVSVLNKPGVPFKLEVTIPANTTATVYVPAKDKDGVTESGEPASGAEGVKFLRMEQNSAVYEVGSGCYKFVSK